MRVEPGDATAVRRPQRVVAPAPIGSLAALRVIEIPTPRRTACDATRRFGTRMPPAEAPMTSQARAYTSPIRYTPSR